MQISIFILVSEFTYRGFVQINAFAMQRNISKTAVAIQILEILDSIKIGTEVLTSFV